MAEQVLDEPREAAEPEPGAPLVLITGATGAIGRRLTAALAESYRVVGMDLECAGANCPCVEVDLGDPHGTDAALAALARDHGGRFAAVVHLAAYFDFTGEPNPLYQRVNVDGSRNLVRALQAYEVERFVFSGTMLVHAPAAPGERVDEETPLAPSWPYPRSKAEAEEVIRQERGGMAVTFLHLAGLYDETTAVPTLAHQIARIHERAPKSRLYAGDQQAGQSLIHIDDLIDLIRRVVDRRGTLPDEVTMLAGEPDAVSYAELQDRIGELIHGEPHWSTFSLPKPLARAGSWFETKAEPLVPDALDKGEKPFERPFLVDMADDHYALDIGRAEELLDWRPRHDIRRDLASLTAALRDDPVGWYEANGVPLPDWLEVAGDEPAAPALRRRYEEGLREEHRRFRWAHAVNAGLGCWLIAAPSSLGYAATPMLWSDLASGVLLVAFGLSSLSWRLGVARWAAAAVGLWLIAAPLLFHVPTAAAYLNGTVVGALAIGLAVLTRPTPGIAPAAAMTGPSVPPGWSFSPSTWLQRLPIILLAVVGFLISRHLAAYQLGHVDGIWEPFFTGGPGEKNGSEIITTSRISEAWPVSDAGLGALVYLLEILTGVIGTNRRWRTMPWLVMLFGFLIVPLGTVSITFIVIQPILLGTYCTLCLVAAAAMVLQIPYSLNEFVATGQFLNRRRRAGRPWLRVFFRGDTDEPNSIEAGDRWRGLRPWLANLVSGGVAFRWNLVASAALGVGLMATPLVLGATGAVAGANHLLGALVFTTSLVATAEVARFLRFLNIGFALAVLIAPIALGAGLTVVLCGVVVAGLLVWLALERGPIHERYGGWERLLV
jgi:nucleoside-diphosphate-sugar epimerase